MTEFTVEELKIINAALDMMVKAEGSGLSQNGLAVLKTNNVNAVLAARLAIVVSISEKVDAEVAAIEAAGAPDSGG